MNTKPSYLITKESYMKPPFLDNPHRYTRSQRQDQQPATYACAIETPNPYRWADLVWVAIGIAAMACVVLFV